MKLKFAFSIVVAAMLFGLHAHAQQINNDAIPLKKLTPKKRKPGAKDSTVVVVKGTPQKDLPQVISEMFHSPAAPEIDSITTKPQISVIPAIGYTLVTNFAIVVSGNV